MGRYILTEHGAVFATVDAGGRWHICPASLRLASDPAFRARVAVRTAARLVRA
jgi:photosystem II stability/assembly factor-like uncharacterized protein